MSLDCKRLSCNCTPYTPMTSQYSAYCFKSINQRSTTLAHTIPLNIKKITNDSQKESFSQHISRFTARRRMVHLPVGRKSGKLGRTTSPRSCWWANSCIHSRLSRRHYIGGVGWWGCRTFTFCPAQSVRWGKVRIRVDFSIVVAAV